MSGAYHRLAFPNIFLKRMMGTVIHDRSKTGPQAGDSLFVADAVVQMHDHRHPAALRNPPNNIRQMPQATGVDGSLSDCQNDRAVLGLSSLHDCLRDFDIVDVEAGDRSIGPLGNFQDLCSFLHLLQGFFQCRLCCQTAQSLTGQAGKGIAKP